MMETLSFIVLILLSLVGYSFGAVAKAGKFIDLKPQIVDLIIVLLIWAGAICSRTIFDLNKWFLILMWVILSATYLIEHWEGWDLLILIDKITPRDQIER